MEEEPIHKSMTKPIIVLTLICIIAGSLIGIAYILTKDKLTNAADSAFSENLKQLFPSADSFKSTNDASGNSKYYLAMDGNNIAGYAVIADSQGYSSVIKMIVGINNDMSLAGIKVLSQAETPGLGTMIAEQQFMQQFAGLKPNEVALKKEGGVIDGITGATISSRAVVNGVNSAISSLAVELGIPVDKPTINNKQDDARTILTNPTQTTPARTTQPIKTATQTVTQAAQQSTQPAVPDGLTSASTRAYN